MSNYTDALKVDKELSKNYYLSSLHKKTEQQKFLEVLLCKLGVQPQAIADIGCGGGGGSYYLAQAYPQASFTLVDENEDAIKLARESTRHFNATCVVGNIYDLASETDAFDMVVCLQTLSWLDEPEIALRELIRICKPGGIVYASSLFNTHHDVDIYATVRDNTRPSTQEGLAVSYNTYSLSTVRKWVSGLVNDLQLHEFDMPIDLEHGGRGLGTYTATLHNGRRLQFSAGMMLNWGILEIRK
jgi:ubiquinone/menaquinone biosynthesis C-methylase UbiE